MDSFEPKKLALIRILQILERYTDCDHPLKHDEIVKKLENDYRYYHRKKSNRAEYITFARSWL